MIDPTFDERPSKTQRKQEMSALQSLGAELVKLTPEQRARIDLPEALRAAIEFFDRIGSFEARRRQMQYIGKLMRSVDADAIRAAIGRANGDSKEAVALMHRCERWRDRLLDDDTALTDFLEAHPQADPQRLRSTIRAARRERAAQRPPKQLRVLYRSLHEILSLESTPS
jgi:ribosome-associated protein